MAPSVSYSITSTAIVVLAALMNALRVVGKKLSDVFIGLLDAQSRVVTDDMLIAAAQAIADVVSPDEIGPHYIIPSVFHPDVASSVAVAVRDAATQQPER